MNPTPSLKVKIFGDGADLKTIQDLASKSWIRGFTTNPSLARKAGVQDYQTFAQHVLQVVTDRPVSFEVLADDFSEMEQEAREIASWGGNVFVKVPITNSEGESSAPLIRQLSSEGIQLNITALLALEQVEETLRNLSQDTSNFISIFAGRVADTGRDPVPMMTQAIRMMKPWKKTELIWASPRELLNIFHADSVGCHVITVTQDIMNKLCLIGKDLNEYSLETVKMFRRDTLSAGFRVQASQLRAQAV